MKVLCVLHPKSKPSTWQKSGDTTMATQLIKELPEGIEVDVFSDFSEFNSGNVGEFHKIMDYYNISGAISSSKFLDKRTYLKGSMHFIRSIADQYDLIHFHSSTVSTVNWINRLFHDCTTPLIYTMHTPPDVGTSFQYHLGDDYKFYSKQPMHRLVAVSPSHYFRTLKALRVTEEEMPSLTYIRNGIDTSDPGTCEESYDVVIVGRLDPSKDILHGLRSACLSTDGPIVYIGDTTPMSIQDDDYYNEVSEFINDNPRITWFKYKTNQEVRQIMKASKVHIALSRIETFGLTVAEALAVGTPIIGFSVGGIGDNIIEGVNGYTLENDRKRWTSRYKKVAELYQEAILLDRDNIKTLAKERFSIAESTSEYVDMYEELQGTGVIWNVDTPELESSSDQ